jgi:lysozyme family protein
MFLDDLRQREPAAAWAIARTLPLEGGWVNDPADPGGATDRGVSLRFALQEIAAHPDERALFDVDHDGDVDWHDIAGLTDDAAAAVYYPCVWRRYGYGSLSATLVAWKAFDICVNTGPRRAAMVLQQALASLGHAVAVDGVLGPATFAAANARIDTQLLVAMRIEQAAFYRGLAAAKPEMGRFLAGWLNRAAA